MSDWTHKTRFAGPPQRDKKREPAPDTLRLPPHKKPREYVLTVEYVDTTMLRYTKRFPSKVAREEARKRIERELAESMGRGHRWRYSWSKTLQSFNAEKLGQIKTGPTYIETMEEP